MCNNLADGNLNPPTHIFCSNSRTCLRFHPHRAPSHEFIFPSHRGWRCWRTSHATFEICHKILTLDCKPIPLLRLFWTCWQTHRNFNWVSIGWLGLSFYAWISSFISYECRCSHRWGRRFCQWVCWIRFLTWVHYIVTRMHSIHSCFP